MVKLELPVPKELEADDFMDLDVLKNKITELKRAAESEGMKMWERYGWECLGSGSESVILRFKKDPDFVVAYSFQWDSHWIKEETAIKVYYLNKMFQTIFPDNFREIPFAIGKLSTFENNPTLQEKKENFLKNRRESDTIKPLVYGTIRKYVELNGVDRAQLTADFKKVFDFILETGILQEGSDFSGKATQFFDLRTNFPNEWVNVTSTTSGKSMYVDTLDSHNSVADNFFVERIVERKNAILKYMQNNNLSVDKIKKVEMCIDRLKNLVEEVKKEMETKKNS